MAADYGNGAPAESAYQRVRERLAQRRHHWLVTGVAGFIGSNLLETLLELGQRVTGLDNFLTGHRHNLEQVRQTVGPRAWERFCLIEGDIRDLEQCRQACAGVDYVLHQAALGSVPRSIVDPLLCNEINIGGFLNMLVAARDAGVARLVYAASSASYGDDATLPKVESRSGRPLSPYALSKTVNELYADVFARCYGGEAIGLRYFNVFGPRQDPQGAYAAVIPLWIAAMIHDRRLVINGDGESSRDFCFVGNVVQANLLAALSEHAAAANQVYNVAAGGRTSLNELYLLLHGLLLERFPHLLDYRPDYADFRAGDVRHSQADIGKAVSLLGYAPTHDVARGLKQAIRWYVGNLAPPR
ncbi:SDR family oxidoreductase [Rugamonas sp. CCM 8940]|uniref:SDR family oxidoreductase n=1 Tax=Rugamonas sp. CCM 8940 TaxID=2765359 RepID=UPI0018F57ECE|nr:SDR family oxidoreductase [Rugamonas sp. CCM 8940]MBJ7313250.1 SDR family oxidoreductase [Rugamonas sp. CCM 8940]